MTSQSLHSAFAWRAMRASKSLRLLSKRALFWPLAVYAVFVFLFAMDHYEDDLLTNLQGLELISEAQADWYSSFDPTILNESWRFETGLLDGAVGGSIFFGAFIFATAVIASLPILLSSVKLVTATQAFIALVIATILVVTAYTVIYQSGGLYINGDYVGDPSFSSALYMSLTMTSSLGFGETLTTEPVRLYAASQAIFGFFLLGAALGIVVAGLSQRQNREDENRPKIVVIRSKAGFD